MDRNAANTPGVPQSGEAENEDRQRSLPDSHRTQLEMTPTAKVTAWLETVPGTVEDESEEDKRISDQEQMTSTAGTTAGSLHLQPIIADMSPRDKATESAFSRRAIPPIVTAITEMDDRGELVLYEDISANSRLSDYLPDDILTNVATVDSSSPSADPSNVSPTADHNVVEGHVTPRDVDTVITVREAEGDKLSALMKKRLLMGANAASKTPVSKTESATPSGEGRASTSGLTFGTIATSLMQWKLTRTRAAKRRKESIAIDARHQAVMDDINKQLKIQIPKSLSFAIKEDVLPILLNTLQAYKSAIGKSHRLTVQTQEKLEELVDELKKPH